MEGLVFCGFGVEGREEGFGEVELGHVGDFLLFEQEEGDE